MLQLGVLYRVGPGGARITWRDGSTSQLRFGTRLMFTTRPRRIEGKLLIADRHFEAPAMKPS